MNKQFKKISAIFIINTLVLTGCAPGYKIKEGTPKAVLLVDITQIYNELGAGSILSGDNIFLNLYPYNLNTCEFNKSERVLHLNGFNLDSSINIPANKPLPMFYQFSKAGRSLNSVSGDYASTTTTFNSCNSPFGFLPEANHKYKLSLRSGSGKCIFKITDLTNKNKNPPLLRIPKSCMQKKHFQ